MTTRDTFDDWAREAREEGIQQGIEKGIEQGIEKGIATSILDIYSARFGAVPPALASLVHATSDSTLLRRWLRVVATAAREDAERLVAEE